MCSQNGCLFSNAGPWNLGNEGPKINIPLDKLPTDEGGDDKDEENDDQITGGGVSSQPEPEELQNEDN